MFVASGILGLALTLTVSLPADWAWRRASELAGVIMAALSIVGIIGCITLIGRLGLLSGFWAVVALVLGVWVGGYVGNALATRLWGPARFWA